MEPSGTHALHGKKWSTLSRHRCYIECRWAFLPVNVLNSKASASADDRLSLSHERRVTRGRVKAVKLNICLDKPMMHYLKSKAITQPAVILLWIAVVGPAGLGKNG